MFKELFRIFREKNYKLYSVGGSVRNILLNLPPNDYDFTTDAMPEKIKEILQSNNYKTYSVGEKFGTIGTIINDIKVEITTHRKDITSGRHPDVAFTTSLKSDLERRDFTINSLALTEDGTIIDYFNGQEDIKRKIIRTTGNPYDRFAEDPLRMLRAVRFASQLNFCIEEETGNAIRTFAPSIMSVSKERWLEEMTKLLNGNTGLDHLRSLGLLGYILPEAVALTFDFCGSKNLWFHTVSVVENAKKIPEVKWAALLHDIAKPAVRAEVDNNIHFFGHEVVGAEMVEGIANRLKMSSWFKKSIVGLVALHHRIGNVVKNNIVSVPALRRVIKECSEYGCKIEHLIDLFEADCSTGKESKKLKHLNDVRLIREELEEIRKIDLMPRLPSGIGNVIMEKYNLKQGAEVGKVKKILEEMLINGDITSKMNIDEILEVYDGI